MPAATATRRPARSTKVKNGFQHDPMPCPACGVDCILVGQGEASHARGCKRRAALDDRNEALRAKLAAARQASIEKAAARAAAQTTRRNIMSTTAAIRTAEADLNTKGMDELKQLAADLKIEGRSKLNKDGLVKAIKKAQAPKAATPKAKSNGAAPKAPAVEILSVEVTGGVIKVGAKVETTRAFDLSKRTEGYAGAVDAGAKGTVTELRAFGRGVQVYVKMSEAKYGTLRVGAGVLAKV